MPLCLACGAQLDSNASFCPNCGNKVETAEPQQTQMSMRDKGSELEDSVAIYFRAMGFETQSRVKMRDHYDVSHEIDVVASKKEDFGTINVAVECKFVTAVIDIKEIRNFHDKLTALGFTKGVFVSTGGFTSDAQADATAYGIELWDEKTLEEKISKLRTPQTGLIRDALPIRPESRYLISPRHLKNYQRLFETLALNLTPFYFVEYKCFSQHSVAGNSVVLESIGKVALEAVTGHLLGSKVSEGEQPAMPGSNPEAYAELLDMRTLELPNLEIPQMPVSMLDSKLDSTRAKDTTKTELVKALSITYRYRLQTRYTSRVKVLQPKKKDIEILNLQSVKVPIIVGTYRFKNYVYTRTCLASTGKLTSDELASCVQCASLPIIVCENCGAVACESHSRKCEMCEKNLCSACTISKGLISKKFYCTEHQSN